MRQLFNIFKKYSMNRGNVSINEQINDVINDTVSPTAIIIISQFNSTMGL